MRKTVKHCTVGRLFATSKQVTPPHPLDVGRSKIGANSSLRLAAVDAKWPFARDEMIVSGLIVTRMAEDIRALFDGDDELSKDALISIGWPEPVVKAYYGAAVETAGMACAVDLINRRNATREAFIPLEPPPFHNENRKCASTQAEGRRVLCVVGIAAIVAGAAMSLLAQYIFEALQ
jgi:hypothetical protein